MLPKCPLWLCFHPPGEHLRRIYLRRLQVDEKKNYFPTCRFLWLLSCEQDTDGTRHWGDKGKRLHNNLRQRASHREKEREMGRLNLIPFADHLPKKKNIRWSPSFSPILLLVYRHWVSFFLPVTHPIVIDFFFFGRHLIYRYSRVYSYTSLVSCEVILLLECHSIFGDRLSVLFGWLVTWTSGSTTWLCCWTGKAPTIAQIVLFF